MHFYLFVRKFLTSMLLKKKRSNHTSFINNGISKAVMTRSRLRNRFLQNRSEENRKLFYKQINKCVSLLRKSKKDYFENPNEKNITYNKSFRKTVKPFLSKKNSYSWKNKFLRRRKKVLVTKLWRSCKRTE